MNKFKQGILVVNHWLRSDKFVQLTNSLINTAKQYNIPLIVKTNQELFAIISNEEKKINGNMRNLPNPQETFILFWDKDILLAQYLELLGYRLFNSAKAIELCDNKALTHLYLSQYNISMPKTFISPKVFEGTQLSELDYLPEIENEFDYPFVLKECFGSFGQGVSLITNQTECINQILQLGSTPFIIQEFIESSYGRDIRIQVVGNEVVAAMYRFSNQDFRANVTNGAQMRAYQPTQLQEQMALKIAKYLSLDFAGIDFLFGKEEEPILCEVNSNAHYLNLMECTNIEVADYIFKWILET